MSLCNTPCWPSCPLKNKQIINDLNESWKLVDSKWELTQEWKNILIENKIIPCSWCINEIIKIIENK